MVCNVQAVESFAHISARAQAVPFPANESKIKMLQTLLTHLLLAKLHEARLLQFARNMSTRLSSFCDFIALGALDESAILLALGLGSHKAPNQFNG